MSQVAKEITKDEFFSQPAREIPLFTLVEIIHKSKSHEKMLYYIKETHKFVAETTLSNSSTHIGISKYKLIEELPNYLAKGLNKK